LGKQSWRPRNVKTKQMRTVLARIHKGEWRPEFYNQITLLILPRQALSVYAGEIEQKVFDELKDNASFLVLEKHPGAHIEYISKVIPPFARTGYKNAV